MRGNDQAPVKFELVINLKTAKALTKQLLDQPPLGRSQHARNDGRLLFRASASSMMRRSGITSGRDCRNLAMSKGAMW